MAKKYWILVIPLGLLIWFFTLIQDKLRGPVLITVSATSGLPVYLAGTCQVMRNGSSQSVDFSGNTPFSKDFAGPAIVSCVAQQSTNKAVYFKLWIKSDEETVARGDTSNPYGVVSVAAKID